MGPNKISALRGFSWLLGALWWAKKTPSGWKPWGWACVPWVVCGAFNMPTAGLSILWTVGAYAYLSLWSCVCIQVAFKGAVFDAKSSKLEWFNRVRSARALAVAFLVIALTVYLWSLIGLECTVLGEFLNELRSTTSQERVQDLWAQYWSKEGFESLAWGVFIQQVGCIIACALWCLLPIRYIHQPHEGVKGLLIFGIFTLVRAPWAMLTLGATGAWIAQIGLAFPPVALLSGFWFLACAFAYRDVT